MRTNRRKGELPTPTKKKKKKQKREGPKIGTPPTPVPPVPVRGSRRHQCRYRDVREAPVVVGVALSVAPMMLNPKTPEELDEALKGLSEAAQSPSIEESRREEYRKELARLRLALHDRIHMSPLRLTEWFYDLEQDHHHAGTEGEKMADILSRVGRNLAGGAAGSVDVWSRFIECSQKLSGGNTAGEAVQRAREEALRQVGGHFERGDEVWSKGFGKLDQAEMDCLSEEARLEQCSQRFKYVLPGNASFLQDLAASDEVSSERLRELADAQKVTDALLPEFTAFEKEIKMQRTSDVDAESVTWESYAKLVCARLGPWQAAALLERALTPPSPTGFHSDVAPARRCAVPLLLADIYARRLSSYERALCVLRKAISASPHEPRLYLALVRAVELHHSKDASQGMDDLEQLPRAVLSCSFPSAEDYLDVVLACASALGRRFRAQLGGDVGELRKLALLTRGAYRSALQMCATYYGEWFDGRCRALRAWCSFELCAISTVADDDAFSCALGAVESVLARGDYLKFASVWVRVIDAISPFCHRLEGGNMFPDGVDEEGVDEDEGEDSDSEESRRGVCRAFPARMRAVRELWKRALRSVRDDVAGCERAWMDWEQAYGDAEDVMRAASQSEKRRAAAEARASAAAAKRKRTVDTAPPAGDAKSTAEESGRAGNTDTQPGDKKRRRVQQEHARDVSLRSCGGDGSLESHDTSFQQPEQASETDQETPTASDGATAMALNEGQVHKKDGVRERRGGVLETRSDGNSANGEGKEQTSGHRANPYLGSPTTTARTSPVPMASSDRQGRTDPLTIMLVNLHYHATVDDIRGSLSHLGDVASVDIPLRPSGKPRGIAFVKFEEEDGATAALGLDGILAIKGRTLQIKAALRKGVFSTGAERPSGATGRTIYATGVPKGIPEVGVKAAFEGAFGIVEKVRLLKEGAKRRAVLVQFAEGDIADRALDAHNLTLSFGDSEERVRIGVRRSRHAAAPDEAARPQVCGKASRVAHPDPSARPVTVFAPRALKRK